MADTLNLDTEKLKELCGALALANEEIADAVSLLCSVQAHNDWGCYERTVINGYIERNKQRIRALQGNGESFLNAVQITSDAMVEKENSIGAMFSTVEDKIRGIVSTIGQALKTVFKVPDAIGSYLWDKAKEVAQALIPVNIPTDWKQIGRRLTTGVPPAFGTTRPASAVGKSALTEPLSTCNLKSLK